MPPGNPLIRPVALKPPKPYTGNAFGNLGVEGSGYATRNVIPAAVPATIPAAVAPPPPPPDFNALTLADPMFLQNKADIARQNDYAMHDLLQNFRRGAQGAQDNANAHGALFSGAAVNAQNQASAAYDQAGTRQAANVLSQQNQNYNAVWQRLLQQLAGGA